VFAGFGYPSLSAPKAGATNLINPNPIQNQTSFVTDISTKPTTPQINQLTNDEPSTNPTVTLTSQPAPKKKKWLALIIGFFILLIILAAAAYYFLVYYDNVQRNQRILIKLLSASIDASSIDYLIKGSIEFAQGSGSDLKQSDPSNYETFEPLADLGEQPLILNYQFTGKEERNTDNKTPVGEFSLVANLIDKANILGSESFTLALDLKSTSDQHIYFRLAQPTSIPIINLTPLLNRWFKTSLAELQSLAPPDLYELDNSKQDLDYWQTVTKIYPKHPFVKITKSSKKNVSNRRLKEYKFEIDNSALTEFIFAVEKEINSHSMNEDLNFDESFDRKFLDRISMNGSFAIDPKTKLIYTFIINTTINDSLFKANLTTELSVKDYNQPVVVTPPSLSESFTKLLEEISNIFDDTSFDLPPIDSDIDMPNMDISNLNGFNNS